ncbi:hypothetical protein [Pedobacter sp. SL55]|uniref:hypothetical protein n=1 Tax=Pedobacter sp. SL55 TaxID=2995161 RepID=UPI0022714D17|nr:hypothetical protein [Pedobacter sp. SL55]WAC42050.1 hypothetical protein OVA16_06740 [Pedobacter sp. SL55]
MKKKYFILILATILGIVGATFKILHFNEGFGTILLGVSLGPYVLSIFSLVFSPANINQIRNIDRK